MLIKHSRRQTVKSHFSLLYHHSFTLCITMNNEQWTMNNEQWTIKTKAVDLSLKQVNDIKSMWEELIKDDSTQQHRGAVQTNHDTTSKTCTEAGNERQEMEIKRETKSNGHNQIEGNK